MAARRRFLAPDAARTEEIRLGSAESHHLLRVLRLRPGAAVEVFDGGGRAFAATFVRADDDGCCRLGRGEPLPAKEPAVRLAVGVAVPKGDGLTGIVRQLAELGVASITPVLTERSEGACSPARLARWRAAALSGTRQCGGAVVPAVSAAAPFAAWIRGELPRKRWIASPGAGGGDAPGAPATAQAADQVLAVGPEGGFATEELDAAYRRGFRRLDLGERTLRTGTAAVVAAAMLLAPPGERPVTDPVAGFPGQG